MEVIAEHRQAEVYRIEHYLDRDQHQDDVAARQETEHSDPEEDGAQSQNHALRDDHDPAALLRVITTVPMMAASRTREVISKGKAKEPNSAMPMAESLPRGSASARLASPRAGPGPSRAKQARPAKQS